jgi:D-amino-acid oxidase
MRQALVALSMASSFFLSALFADVTPEVIKLTPPIITNKTIAKKIACTRPVRKIAFNVSVQDYVGKNSVKTIVHCYGHGGWGWTTLFGSVQHAIELFQKTNPSKETPIRVVGAGCVGLTVAAELARLGYTVKGITAKEVYDTPSWNAGGSFSGSLSRILPEEKAKHLLFKKNTFLTFRQIEQGVHPYLHSGCVRFLPSYTHRSANAGLQDLIDEGLVPQPRPVVLDFGKGVLHPDYEEYKTYFMDVTRLMQQLQLEVQRNHIAIEIRELASFDEVSEEVIFNCTGLGAKALNQDSELKPYRGHLIMLSQDAGAQHLEYMIDSGMVQDGIEEDVYLFPKRVMVTAEHPEGIPCAGVCGGTYIPNVDQLSAEELQKLDEREFQRLLDRLSIFFTGHPF